MEFRQIAIFHDLSDLPTEFKEKRRVSAIRRLTRDFRARVTEYYRNEAEFKKATQLCICALIQLFDPKTNVGDTRLSTIEPGQDWCESIAQSVVNSGSKFESTVPESDRSSGTVITDGHLLGKHRAAIFILKVKPKNHTTGGNAEHQAVGYQVRMIVEGERKRKGYFASRLTPTLIMVLDGAFKHFNQRLITHECRFRTGTSILRARLLRIYGRSKVGSHNATPRPRVSCN
jgi:hypothetical protein